VNNLKPTLTDAFLLADRLTAMGHQDIAQELQHDMVELINRDGFPPVPLGVFDWLCEGIEWYRRVSA
jgi:hypothetical protein